MKAETREMLVRACTMRIDGHTFEEIAQELGVSKQYVHRALQKCVVNEPYAPVGIPARYKNIVYPYITEYLHKRRMTVKELSIQADLDTRMLRDSLAGRRKVDGEMVIALLKATGIAPENLLKTEKAPSETAISEGADENTSL